MAKNNYKPDSNNYGEEDFSQTADQNTSTVKIPNEKDFNDYNKNNNNYNYNYNYNNQNNRQNQNYGGYGDENYGGYNNGGRNYNMGGQRQNNGRPYQNGYSPAGNVSADKTNTALIAVISVLGVLLVAGVVFLILTLTGVIGKPDTEPVPIVDSVQTETESQTSEQTETTKEPAPTPVTMYVANVKNSIHFRTSPTEVDSNIICDIPVRTAVSFLENVDAVFAKITYNGQEGYVKREYLSSTMPAAEAPKPSASSGNTTVSRYMYVANVKNSIYLRNQPVENDSNINCTIPLGARVGYIERTDNVFSKINYNGKYGYVKTEYLASSPPSNGPTEATSYATIANVKTSAYFRRNPSGSEDKSNIICEIPLGTRVIFIEETNSEYSQISYNGQYGYVKSQYLAH